MIASASVQVVQVKFKLMLFALEKEEQSFVYAQMKIECQICVDRNLKCLGIVSFFLCPKNIHYSTHPPLPSQMMMMKCCITSTETVGLLGTGAQDGHLDFHTAPEL